NERMVGAKIISTGMNGGEILLSELIVNGKPDIVDGGGRKVSPFEHLKSGQWIMLCGPHPNSTFDTPKPPAGGEPRFVLNWYQVVSIEGRESRLNYQGTADPAPGAS